MSTGTVSDANPCEPGVGKMIDLGFALSLVLGIRKEENVTATRAIGVFSGASVVTTLVVVPVVTFLGT